MARTPLFAALARTLHNSLRGTESTRIASSSLARRRSFLQAMSAGALGATLPALGGCDDDEEPTEDVIAIIGGGMAGIHCAYRLQEAGIIGTVYEAQDRLGGRMFSAAGLFPEAPDQICELGGELIDTGHLTLHALATELGLVLDDRAAEPVGISGEVYWVNGAAVPEATITSQFVAVAPTIAADFDAAETDDAAYAALDVVSIDQYLKDKVPVATYPELHAVLQAAYRGEYGLENTEQSCLNLVYLIGFDEPDPFRIFGVSDERYHTHLGNDSFPLMLAEKLPAEQKKLQYKLLAARDADGGFELDFETPAGPETVSCTRIVFSVPFSVLRDVDLSGLTLSDDKRTSINELGYGTNAKVMAGFSTRVWRTSGMQNGSLTTDMGVQQTWETTIGQDGAHGILTNFLGGAQGLASGTGSEVDWITGVLPDLEQVWPGVTAAFTGTAIRMHWPTVPTTKGSYACYRPGQWAFYGTEGEREGNVHFCGEHTSLDFQGYMEGAAETGALVAAEIIDEGGGTMPQGMQQALNVKLSMPQAQFRASGLSRINPLARRRLWREKLAELAGKIDSAG